MRERASWVGEGRRPRRKAKARGERLRPPRARALAAPSSRADVLAGLPPLPPSRGSCRARAFILPSPMATARAAECTRARARSRGGSARLGFSLPRRVRRGGPPAAVFADIFSARRGLRRPGPAAGSFPPRFSGVRPTRPSRGPGVGPGASHTMGRRAAPSPISQG